MEECQFCDRVFRRQSNLQQHLKVHLEVRAFLCDVCNASFVKESHFTKHKLMHERHNQSTHWVPKTLKPQICATLHPSKPVRPARPLSTRSLLRRVNILAGTTTPGLSESQSAAAISDRLIGYRHECIDCHKLFKQKSALKKHRRTHTGEKPYRCPFCPKAFADATNFKRHKVLHKRAAKELETASKTKLIAPPLTAPSPVYSTYSDPDPDGFELMQQSKMYLSNDSDDSELPSDMLWLNVPIRELLNSECDPSLLNHGDDGIYGLVDTID